MTISLVMQCLNEAEFIGDALAATVPFVDEAVVIDQGSTDGTLDILKRFRNVRVVRSAGTFLTRGEKYYRDLAIQLCTSDWLMLLDADEIMSPGWSIIARGFLSEHKGKVGMALADYYQMVGSPDFHTPDSPLPNERPILVRRHPRLQATESLNETKCHCSYAPFIEPKNILRLPSSMAIFHLGYCKTDLATRFERNIERGDWERTEAGKLALLKRAVEDPISLLQNCVPSRIPIELLPECLRISKWRCDYDAAAQRITSRVPA